MAHTDLDLRERRANQDVLNAKVPVSKNAAELGRHRSTVYRESKRNGFKDDLSWHLSTHRVARRPRGTRRRKEPKFHRDVSILFRPDDVAHRRQFGHWEADFMLFKQKLGQANVT